MSLGRFLPNTRETAEEVKRRVWQQHGMLVVHPEKDALTWDAREFLKVIGRKLYGPRRVLEDETGLEAPEIRRPNE